MAMLPWQCHRTYTPGVKTLSGSESEGREASNAYRQSDRRIRAGRPAPWHQVPPEERDAHDWLYAAARRLLEDGQEVAARLVMDFADETDEILMSDHPLTLKQRSVLARTRAAR